MLTYYQMETYEQIYVKFELKYHDVHIKLIFVQNISVQAAIG